MNSFRVPIETRSEAIFPLPLRGRVETHRFTSRLLEGNPWGDPVERDLPVYLPPSGKTEGRPLLVLLSGYSGAGWMHFLRPRYMTDTIVGRLDRLMRTGQCPEAVLVAPDCLTTLGGSQYINSSATGPYEDYIVREIVPFVRERYRTGPCGVMGTSSGGYGAMSLGLRHPDLFPAVASNAGDALFELCYPPDFWIAFREIRAEGGPEPLLRRIFTRPISGFGPGAPLAKTLSVFAYASCYSPRAHEPGRFDLPFDAENGAMRDDVWVKWLAADPVRMVAKDPYRDAVRRLRYLYVDGGRRDEYGLDVAARAFAAKARDAGATVDHEEFDGVHADGGPRYEIFVPRMLAGLGFRAEASGPTSL